MRNKRGSSAILAAGSSVNDLDRKAGASWYADAGELCAALPGGARVGAGVVAALSPRVPWSVNVAAARDLLEGREVRGVLGANVEKARRIAAGEPPEAVLGGPKVRSDRGLPSAEDGTPVSDHRAGLPHGRPSCWRGSGCTSGFDVDRGPRVRFVTFRDILIA